mgnify:CR=1 FL=1
MYKRLLVPTDGSELSLDAVRGAASFAEAMHSEVVLITVIEPYSYTSLSEYRPESIDDYDERVRTVAEERLAEARAILEEKGIKVLQYVRVCGVAGLGLFRRRKPLWTRVPKRAATACLWPATAARALPQSFWAVKPRRCSRIRKSL